MASKKTSTPKAPETVPDTVFLLANTDTVKYLNQKNSGSISVKAASNSQALLDYDNDYDNKISILAEYRLVAVRKYKRTTVEVED